MKNSTFAVTVGAVVGVSLGAVALRYHLQIPSAVRPVIVVYHDNALLPGQDRLSSDRYWTLAVRSDGASMKTNSVPDATGHIATVKSIEFKDRYVVVDPLTKSISTYKPYVPVIAATENCSGSSTDPILGHPIEYLRSDLRESVKSGVRTARERWLAVDLNCAILREHLTTTDKDGKVTQLYREAVSVKSEEPPTDYFNIPPGYQERGPAEVSSESEANGHGKILPNKESLDKLQKVYDSDRKLK
jgi:hypothetical protein